MTFSVSSNSFKDGDYSYCVTIFDVYVVLQVARHSKGSVTAWRREQRSNSAVLWQ
jgi:hypothetical protein